ncbi:MAG: pyridoxamine 5'-phosphate oxidase family protein [Vulcanimicrobiaceae bacterium]
MSRIADGNFSRGRRKFSLMSTVTSVAELEAIYGQPGETSTRKIARRLTPHYRALLEASPFAVLATSGPEGLDCSPRGERDGLVRVVDDATLLLPDRRGNNRIDSLRNIVRDPRVGLLFLIPGLDLTLRVNGRAHVSIDADLCASFAVDGKPPRSVVSIALEEVYFQCARAIVRSDLWNAAHYVDASCLPTAGSILAAMTDDRIGGPDYDLVRVDRQLASLW